MLLDDVDVDHEDCAEAYIVCEPKGLDKDVLLCEFVDEQHDVLRSLRAFLDVSPNHRVRISGPATKVGKVVEQK